MNRRFFAALFVFAAFVLTIPFITRAGDTTPYKSFSRSSVSSTSARSVYGAQIGYWDPGASGSIDTGYVDTSGCQSACLAAMVEVESATTALSCTTYGGYLQAGAIVGAAMGSAVSVSASSTSWGNSVCAGAAGTGAGLQFPLPQYVRVYCASVAGVNARAFMSCH
jgi:hypothetical protein